MATDNFSEFGFTMGDTSSIYIYFTALTLPIFLMSVYLAAAFTIVGTINYLITKLQKSGKQ